MTTDFEAIQWREYVRNPRAWNEAAWEAAQVKGLATRRVKRREDGGPGEHYWVLTDVGLDLFITGASGAEVAEIGLQPSRPQ